MTTDLPELRIEMPAVDIGLNILLRKDALLVSPFTLFSSIFLLFSRLIEESIGISVIATKRDARREKVTVSAWSLNN